eukprot:scaffold48416_cov56-Phaeocystis_antarctica.AAC.3
MAGEGPDATERGRGCRCFQCERSDGRAPNPSPWARERPPHQADPLPTPATTRAQRPAAFGRTEVGTVRLGRRKFHGHARHATGATPHVLFCPNSHFGALYAGTRRGGRAEGYLAPRRRGGSWFGGAMKTNAIEFSPMVSYVMSRASVLCEAYDYIAPCTSVRCCLARCANFPAAHANQPVDHGHERGGCKVALLHVEGHREAEEGHELGLRRRRDPVRGALHPQHHRECFRPDRLYPAALNWTEWITRRFGFLTGWFGRGMFYLFVGTNIMNPYTDNAGLVVLTFTFGFACVFVGAVELIFGFKCAPSSADAEAPRARTESAGPSISSGGPSASGEPTFNVTVTPSQAAALAARGGNPRGRGGSPACKPELEPQPQPDPDQALQGAKLAASAGATLAPLAASAGGKPANPFLGNSHLSEQRA